MSYELEDIATAPICDQCHNEKEWRDCTNCDDNGMDGHDCGEDTCCCLYPEPNMSCEICDGETGWFQCWTCHPWED